MEITREAVQHIARLSKLAFDDEDLENMREDLAKIVTYVEKLEELDVDGVPETAHVLPLTNIFREDKVEPGLTNEQALANAPRSKNGYFSVPKVLG